jgi:WD40 repeat protein
MNIKKLYSLSIVFSLFPTIGWAAQAKNVIKKEVTTPAIGSRDTFISDPEEKIKNLQKEVLRCVEQICLNNAVNLYTAKIKLAADFKKKEHYLEDSARWLLTNTLTKHSDVVKCLQWNAFKNVLVSGGDDSHVSLWDTDKWICKRYFDGKSNKIFSVSTNRDCTRLVVGAHSAGTVLDMTNGNVIKSLGTHGCNRCTEAWSPNGKYIASRICGNEVRILDANSSDFKEVVKFTLDGCSGYLSNIVWGGESQYIVSGAKDKYLKVRYIKDDKDVVLIEPHTQEVKAVAISPNDKLLASASKDRTVAIWDTEKWTCIKHLKGHENEVNCVDFDQKSVFLVSGGTDHLIKIWCVKTGACLYTLKGHAAAVTSVAWGPQSCRIASGSEDKTIKIWSKFYEALKLQNPINEEEEEKKEDFCNDSNQQKKPPF